MLVCGTLLITVPLQVSTSCQHIVSSLATICIKSILRIRFYALGGSRHASRPCSAPSNASSRRLPLHCSILFRGFHRIDITLSTNKRPAVLSSLSSPSSIRPFTLLPFLVKWSLSIQQQPASTSPSLAPVASPNNRRNLPESGYAESRSSFSIGQKSVVPSDWLLYRPF